MRSLKSAYRKIFMASDGTSGSFEDRLAEVVYLVPFLFLQSSELIKKKPSTFSLYT